MHDLLECVLQYEVKLLLHVIIQGKYFNLENFLENTELGYMECKNRPSIISVTTFNSDRNSLKQNGMYVVIVY